MSSKSVSKRSLSRTGSSSDSEVEQAPPLPLVAQSSVQTAATTASKPKPIDMTPEEYKSQVQIEAAEQKRRVEEEYKRKMEQADVKALEKIKMMEKKREMKDFKEKCAPIKIAIQKSMKAVQLRLKFLNKVSLEKALPSPSILTAEIVQEALESCAGLATSPELANLVLAQVKPLIVNSIKSAYNNVASSNPHLVKEGVDRLPEWEQFSTEHAQEAGPVAQKVCRRRRSASQGSQEGSASSSVEKKRCRRDFKHAEKHGHHGFGHHGHHHGPGHHGHGHHGHHGHEEFSHKHGHGQRHSEERHERARLREERRAAKDAERAQKDESKQGLAELKDKVRALKDQFPRMDKQELKQIVQQNAAVAVSQLIDLVKAYKRNKSSAAK